MLQAVQALPAFGDYPAFAAWGRACGWRKAGARSSRRSCATPACAADLLWWPLAARPSRRGTTTTTTRRGCCNSRLLFTVIIFATHALLFSIDLSISLSRSLDVSLSLSLANLLSRPIVRLLSPPPPQVPGSVSAAGGRALGGRRRDARGAERCPRRESAPAVRGLRGRFLRQRRRRGTPTSKKQRVVMLENKFKLFRDLEMLKASKLFRL